MTDFPSEAAAVARLTELKGPAFAEYRRQWDAANRFDLETDFPLFLHIEPFHACNYRCPMCVQGQPELRRKFSYPEQMHRTQVRSLLTEGCKWGCPSVSFQGDNEPFLKADDTVAQIEIAAEMGYQDIMVNTNGSIMSESLAERLVRSGLTRLRFSLDAVTAETYAQIRVGGTLATVIANLETFLSVRRHLNSPLPMVGVNFLRLQANLHEEDIFIRTWRNKVDFIVRQNFITPDIADARYRDMDVADRTPPDAVRCSQPWQRLYIRGNGEVTPCCAMFGRYLTLGTLAENSLHDLWQSPKMQRLRALHRDGRGAEEPVCAACARNGMN